MRFELKSIPFLFIFFLYAFASGQSQVIEENEINDKLVEDFGNAIQQSIHNEDTDAYLELFSVTDFTNRLSGIDAKNSQYKKGFIQGVVSSISQLPKKIIQESSDGYYDFVNYYYDATNQTYQTLFRLYNPYGGINYHSYTLVKNPEGEGLLFSDLYVYLAGENFSDTLGRLFKASLSNDQNSKNQEFNKLLNILKANAAGDFKKSMNYANKVNGDLKDDKFFMILKVIIASNIGEDQYLESLKDLIRVHGDDPTINLHKIDYYLYIQEYDNVKKTVEQLMDNTQDDFLQLFLGNLYLEQKKFAEAQEYFKYMVDNYEGFYVAQNSYLLALTSNKDYDKAVQYLDILLSEYDKQDLINFIEEPEEDGSNVFDAFMETNNYKTWKKQ